MAKKSNSKTATTLDAIRFFWQASLRYKWLGFGSLFFSMFAVAADSTAPWIIKWIFDLLETNTPSTATIDLFLLPVLTLGAIYLLGWIGWRIFDVFSIPFQIKARMEIEHRAFARVFKNSQRFFADNFAGSLIKKIGRAADGFERFADQVVFSFVPAMIAIVAALVGLALRFPMLSVIFGAWTIGFVIFQIVASKWAIKADVIRAELDSKAGATLSDALTNATTIKLHATEKAEHERFKRDLGNFAKAQNKSWWRHSIIVAVQSLLMVLLEVALIYIAVQAWLSESITLGDIAFIQAFARIVFMRLWDLGRSFRHTFDATVNAKEILEILNEPVEIEDRKGAKDLVVEKAQIEFEAVDFGFIKRQNVLKTINLRIDGGEKVAFVGPSGAGKSTITKLLFRFYDAKKGTVLIDGQDISKVTQSSLRESISLVPQDPILFHRSILDNIRYGNPNATKEDVIEAAKRAHCHEFITKLQKGYDTFVGERGVKLSGGERQRVAIARAILRNAPILILDEATSALDSASEHLIQEALEELMKNKTVIVIAHRLSTIKMMDRIVVIENGQITDTGTHDELVKNRGTYNQLWELQAGAFES